MKEKKSAKPCKDLSIKIGNVKVPIFEMVGVECNSITFCYVLKKVTKTKGLRRLISPTKENLLECKKEIKGNICIGVTKDGFVIIRMPLNNIMAYLEIKDNDEFEITTDYLDGDELPIRFFIYCSRIVEIK